MDSPMKWEELTDGHMRCGHYLIVHFKQDGVRPYTVWRMDRKIGQYFKIEAAKHAAASWEAMLNGD